MKQRIAIVGTGPTGVYALRELLACDSLVEVTLYERTNTAGVGMPYSPQSASKTMLANIASIEIPAITTTYLEWLNEQPTSKLVSFGLEPDDLKDRQFTPRLLLGEYFRDQLLAMVDGSARQGHQVVIRENVEVLDIFSCADGLQLLLSTNAIDGPFDRVILATGHKFPEDEAANGSYFPSPWSGLIATEIPATEVGIMGTSLSSVDATMAVACQHGRFRRDGENLFFQMYNTGLRITMMSRSGILPEADFYCPLPYEPLAVMTEASVAACALTPRPLDALFDLFRNELMNADPAFALRIGLGGLDADSFAIAYFAARETTDPFEWARRNLEEVEQNKAARVTVAWRYAILRMHEKAEDIVADLSEQDRVRFDAGLKKVFVDNYAAVPSESIRRLLALHDAGVLSILALGQDYDLTRQTSRTVINAEHKIHEFEVFIDARGQQQLCSKDFPFPTLRVAFLSAGQEHPEIAEDFSILGVEGFSGRVFLASIPYLMHDRPFVQGITASADIAKAMACGISTRRRRLVAHS